MSDLLLAKAAVSDRFATVAVDVAPTAADLVIDAGGFTGFSVQIAAPGLWFLSATANKLYSGKVTGRWLRLHINRGHHHPPDRCGRALALRNS